MQTVVELEGVNGERFTLTGPHAGDRGVYLATGVTGLYDPPVKTVYEEPGNFPGARYLNHRILRRDLVFAVYILNDKGANSWLSRDSEWRKAWAFDRDCKLYVTTAESGTRYLKVRLFESIDVSTETDPNGNSANLAKMVCVAGDPFWYEDDVVYSAVTETDTTFDPNAMELPWPWPKTALPSEDLTIVVDPSDGRGGLNPTDQYIFPKWSVPGSTEAPAEPYIPGIPWLGAPKSKATIWTLPDYSFEDPEFENRRVRLPALIGGLRSNEVQVFNLDGKITGGTFKIKLGEEWTTDLAYNASVGTVKAALEALASVAYNDCIVSRAGVTKEVQSIEILGGPTGGDFTLEFDGSVSDPIPWNVTPVELGVLLNSLSTIGAFNLSVDAQVKSEQQSIQITGEPTGGTFTLTFDGHTTDDIPWNASALVVYAKLQELPGMELLSYSVTKKLFQPWSPYIITFGGQFKGVNLEPMTGNGENLTGGAGADVVVSTVQQGSSKFKVKFITDLAGYNVPELVPDFSGLTGGNNPSVEVKTVEEGQHPYVLSFQNGCSGVKFPVVEIDVSGLTTDGGAKFYRAWKTVKGNVAPAENCAVDTDPRVEQVVSESGSALWARMNGVRFRHPIPPWTPSKTFNISVSGCEPGQMVTLRLPRPWSRPWGLE